MPSCCHRQVPEGTGWVIDGFPQNYNQAKLLEKGLSGFDANAKEAPTKPARNQPRRKSSLVPDPRPPPPPPEPTSGIDAVIVFDVDDNVCLKRAAGRSCEFLCGASRSTYWGELEQSLFLIVILLSVEE